jgi:hypothetical protein
MRVDAWGDGIYAEVGPRSKIAGAVNHSRIDGSATLMGL